MQVRPRVGDGCVFIQEDPVVGYAGDELTLDAKTRQLNLYTLTGFRMRQSPFSSAKQMLSKADKR